MINFAVGGLTLFALCATASECGFSIVLVLCVLAFVLLLPDSTFASTQSRGISARKATINTTEPPEKLPEKLPEELPEDRPPVPEPMVTPESNSALEFIYPQPNVRSAYRRRTLESWERRLATAAKDIKEKEELFYHQNVDMSTVESENGGKPFQ